MYNKNTAVKIGLSFLMIVLVGALLFGLWGLFFKGKTNIKPTPDPNPPVIVDPVEEQEVIEFKNYKVYKFDNINYRFVITEFDSEEKVDLRQITTNEHFSLNQSNGLVQSLKSQGFVLDMLNDKTILIPIYDSKLDKLVLESEEYTLRNYEFNLNNPIEDKTVLGFKEEIDEPDDTPDPVIPDAPSVTSLMEVDSNSISVMVDGVAQAVGFPSNIRIYVLEVTNEESSPIVDAQITFVKDNLTFNASQDPLIMLSTNQANILHRTDIQSGLLFFEVNTAQFNITDLDYSISIRRQ